MWEQPFWLSPRAWSFSSKNEPVELSLTRSIVKHFFCSHISLHMWIFVRNKNSSESKKTCKNAFNKAILILHQDKCYSVKRLNVSLWTALFRYTLHVSDLPIFVHSPLFVIDFTNLCILVIIAGRTQNQRIGSMALEINDKNGFHRFGQYATTSWEMRKGCQQVYHT